MVAITLTTAAPAMVPVTPKIEATAAADTDASVLAHTWVPVTSSPESSDPRSSPPSSARSAAAGAGAVGGVRPVFGG